MKKPSKVDDKDTVTLDPWQQPKVVTSAKELIEAINKDFKKGSLIIWDDAGIQYCPKIDPVKQQIELANKRGHKIPLRKRKSFLIEVNYEKSGDLILAENSHALATAIMGITEDHVDTSSVIVKRELPFDYPEEKNIVVFLKVKQKNEEH